MGLTQPNTKTNYKTLIQWLVNPGGNVPMVATRGTNVKFPPSYLRRTVVVVSGFALALLLLSSFDVAHAQEDPDSSPPLATEETITAPDRVDVDPAAEDPEIAERLEGILEATSWFEDPTVTVSDGVVFLTGTTEREQYRTWAGDLARNTQDVAAVVNNIRVVEPIIWNLQPAANEMRKLTLGFVNLLPLVLISIFILVFAWFLALLVRRGAKRLLKQRVSSPLLRQVVAFCISVPILLIAIYVVLQILGLTRLAFTVIGGTGLAGLIVGIAFSDILENLLASILISVNNPFEAGDRVEVAGHLGIVKQVTSRGTVLMTFDGNHVQIPNATIYKSTIVNFTSNPLRRVDFEVGIGYEDSISGAQDLIRGLLEGHAGVLVEPSPLVLVDRLASSSVILHIYFWVNTVEQDLLKVKSSVIRQVKQALETQGFSMPDEAREVIFPKGVPLQGFQSETAVLSGQNGEQTTAAQQPTGPEPRPHEPLYTPSEGSRSNEDEEIREQARNAPSPEGEQNFLATDLSEKQPK